MIYSGIPVGTRPHNHVNIMGNTQQPWLPIESIEFLEKSLKNDFIGLEFGCGSSTFWFSKIVKKIYSIESDIKWYESIKEIIKEFSIENVDISCIPCDMRNIYEIDNEVEDNYVRYSNSVLEIKEELDFILVDGVARSLCIENSIKKIKTNGYLIIDNAERPAYHDAISKIPKNWECFEFLNAVDKTLIFIKTTD